MRLIPLFAFVALTFAAVAPAHAEMKFGYVDLQRALREVDEGRAAMEKLKAEFTDKQTTLDKQKSELEKMKDDLDKQADLMKEEGRRAKEKELQEKFIKWQTTGMSLQKDLDEKQGELTTTILRKMEEVLTVMSRDQGFDLILVKESVLYAAPSLDLTNELIRRYNERFKAAAGTPAPAAKKADPKGGKK